MEKSLVLKCGIDEAGRGPLAGPVSAACVLLPSDFPLDCLNDSKKLTEKKREKAEAIIKETACWGISFVDHTMIDKINILQATLLAMKQAYEMMVSKLPEWLKAHGVDAPQDFEKSLSAIVDGISIPAIGCNVRCEPKADAKYAEVMAASILAKVGRDRLMIEYDKQYPEYGYAKHKGYPTPAHKKICRELGPSPIQRLSFSYK